MQSIKNGANLLDGSSVRAGYLELAQQEPGRWVVLDASQPWELVQAALRNAILARIEIAA